MRTSIAAAIFLITPLCAQAQDFETSGEIRLKNFLLTDEPDIIRKSYTGYKGEPSQELGLRAHFHLNDWVNVDAYPYFWYSEENRMARIGLNGTIHREVFDGLEFGYGHHSWHNADVDAPHHSGRAQDWFFADWSFAEFGLGSLKAKFTLEPKYYVNNKEPIEIKLEYDSGETKAIYEVMVKAEIYWRNFTLDLKPYVQVSNSDDRYGIFMELSHPIQKSISVFADLHYYRTGSEDRLSIGIGISVAFK